MCKSLSYPGCTEYVRAWTWTEWPWERPVCCPCYVRIRAGRWFSDSASPQHASCTETSTRWSRPSNSQSRTLTGSPGSAIDPISSTEHENAPKDNAAEFKRQFCITKIITKCVTLLHFAVETIIQNIRQEMICNKINKTTAIKRESRPISYPSSFIGGMFLFLP